MPASSHKTLTVTRSDFTMNSEYAATLKGVQSVEVRPQVSGTITQICVSEGADVKKGQVLFVIDQVPYQAALENAEAQVASARAQLDNALLTLRSKQSLHQQQVVGDFEVEQAQHNVNQLRASLRNAEASLTAARNNLSYTVIKSPANGCIGMIPYRVGALVDASISEPLATVSDPASVYAYFSISEAEMQRLLSNHGSLAEAVKAMPAVRLRLADGSEYVSEGCIDAISGNIDAGTGAVTLRASFPNPQQKLRHGGTGTIIVPRKLTDVIVIPQEATYELQDKHFVYAVVNGKTKATPIQVSDYDNGKQFVVTSGLKEGDRIIAEGAGLLHDGMEVGK
ncbi:MAG: efflux RND transporter periplasmic adaptor subunit [Alloprevotella sp.]